LAFMLRAPQADGDMLPARLDLAHLLISGFQL
jgi:hypothetical protein